MWQIVLITLIKQITTQKMYIYIFFKINYKK